MARFQILARVLRPIHAGGQRLLRILRWLGIALLLLVVADIVYLRAIWPEWDQLAKGPVPKSAFIRQYERDLSDHKDWPKLRWQPVPFTQLPRSLVRAAIVAEDSRFYAHQGVDLDAFRVAMEYNLEHGKVAFGGSTISQQTAKNVFLSRSRNPFRKLNELVLTWAMERHLSKQRIMELYLNVAEFGRGIYGAQAASRFYYGSSAGGLSARQAAELIASLPSPVRNNPGTRTKRFLRRAAKIERLMTLTTRVPRPVEAAPAPEPSLLPSLEDLVPDEDGGNGGDGTGGEEPEPSPGAV